MSQSSKSYYVLNDSGITGAAKKIADKLKDLGYPIVKVGNADKDNLVLADIKDIVKITSSSGNLKDSTASARIILGKQ